MDHAIIFFVCFTADQEKSGFWRDVRLDFLKPEAQFWVFKLLCDVESQEYDLGGLIMWSLDFVISPMTISVPDLQFHDLTVKFNR